jgi:phage baseplate assembly protein W
MTRHLFKGFSTFPNGTNTLSRNWTLYDLELVKRDLLNHFHTRRGERAMMPTYGCLIWDLLFEPLTESNVELIVEEARRVINADSRVRIETLNVTEVEQGLVVSFVLYFEPWGVVENFSVEFDRRTLEGVNT